MTAAATTAAPLASRIVDHFGADVIASSSNPPEQVQSFHATRGWETLAEPATDLSVARLRALAADHVVSITVRVDGRYADFTIAEIVAHAARPLLGGTSV